MPIKFNKQTLKNAYAQGQKAAENMKQKAEEFIQKADMAINPPKIDVLREKMVDLEKNYLLQEVKTKYAKQHCRTEAGISVALSQEKELMHAQERAQKAVDAYNKFKSKQDAAQAAFERLNGLNK